LKTYKIGIELQDFYFRGQANQQSFLSCRGSGDGRMPETKKPDKLRRFGTDLQLLRHRATDLRLDATGRCLDSAILTLGLEIAGRPDSGGKCERAQAAPKRQTALAANGKEFLCREATPCPDCGSTERETRTYGGNWDDADFHCSNCGKLIQRAWLAV
jgi:hypothetical protein